MTLIIPEPAFSRDESWFRLVGYIESVAAMHADGVLDVDLGISEIFNNMIDYAEMLEDDRMKPIREFIQAGPQDV